MKQFFEDLKEMFWDWKKRHESNDYKKISDVINTLEEVSMKASYIIGLLLAVFIPIHIIMTMSIFWGLITILLSPIIGLSVVMLFVVINIVIENFYLWLKKETN